ncbi:MAG TPA: adenosylcobinamide amidohydrolase [Nitrospiraceae bacterium]|jgi:iron complex transport system ATP-binding protein|nr:adenosylcobinamide amidohydrolase [Nitrospiraceae bacterium]
MERHSSNWLGSYYRVIGTTLVIDLGHARPVLSSAPHRGGFVRIRYILNHQVELLPEGSQSKNWCDPGRYLTRVAASLGIHHRCVGFMTAVPMTRLVMLREEDKRCGLWVECFCTVGVTNAVKAGEPPVEPQFRRPLGTINIILVTNARLVASAMVGAVQVATESKAAVLLERVVRSSVSGELATGTGTDAVAVACGLRGEGPVLRYSGTHTEIGAMIGRVVRQGVQLGLDRTDRRSNGYRSGTRG